MQNLSCRNALNDKFPKVVAEKIAFTQNLADKVRPATQPFP